MKKWVLSYTRKGLAAALVGVACLWGIGYGVCPYYLCAKDNTQVVRGDVEHYAAKAHISFENGHAVLGLYDTQAAWEFSERQPLAITLQRKGTRIIMPDLPESMFLVTTQTGMKPRVGDIAMDIKQKNIVIFGRDEDASMDFIPIGHVMGGMNYLLQTEGTFDGYVVRDRNEVQPDEA